MNLILLNTTLSVVKLPSSAKVPNWANEGDFVSMTYTEDELSIVCPSSKVPDDVEDVEHDWKCLKVDGVLDFSLTGILSELARPLADERISIFAISTFNTDYLLVKSNALEKAIDVLLKEGHTFQHLKGSQ
ncbi:ACT domain-containing protein [Bacillus sp. 179-C3.3 HS]|uniref:ACT domain-containing protein n=1 Tax=Bacillus sp. 179-C3.3 HS TaxID=3232162 RepID=UPI0039A3108D